ncbi:hypothetical protein ACJJTC_002661 [Scirpophaga incertulas]
MRREFILLLLGIIAVSTLSSLMSGYTRLESDKILFDSVVGVVGAGNFSYWQLGHNGPLLVELTSITGDADLYISETLRPSYEVDMNNFSSVTCGLDAIKIPVDFPRPIGIGVFGHWSHYVSEYSIQVFLDTTAVLTEEQVQAIEEAQRRVDVKQGKDGEKREAAMEIKIEDDSRPRFLRIINFLDMIFEMFVL